MLVPEEVRGPISFVGRRITRLGLPIHTLCTHSSASGLTFALQIVQPEPLGVHSSQLTSLPHVSSSKPLIRSCSDHLDFGSGGPRWTCSLVPFDPSTSQ